MIVRRPLLRERLAAAEKERDELRAAFAALLKFADDETTRLAAEPPRADGGSYIAGFRYACLRIKQIMKGQQ